MAHIVFITHPNEYVSARAYATIEKAELHKLGTTFDVVDEFNPARRGVTCIVCEVSLLGDLNNVPKDTPIITIDDETRDMSQSLRIQPDLNFVGKMGIPAKNRPEQWEQLARILTAIEKEQPGEAFTPEVFEAALKKHPLSSPVIEQGTYYHEHDKLRPKFTLE